MALAGRWFVRRGPLSAGKPLPVASALLTPAAAALLGSPILAGCPPTRPTPRRRLAGGAAIPGKRMAGPEAALAALQETPPAARAARQAERRDAGLMRRPVAKMLMWAHGSLLLPSGQVSEWSCELLLRDAFSSAGD